MQYIFTKFFRLNFLHLLETAELWEVYVKSQGSSTHSFSLYLCFIKSKKWQRHFSVLCAVYCQ